jgi:hypothetical protein
METLLIAVTAISLAMATGMAIVVAKLLREDRARSEARVAALAALSAEPVAPLAGIPDARSLHVGVEQIADTAATARTPAARRTHAQPSRLADFEIRRTEPVASGVPELFAQRDQPSPWGRRIAAVAGLATIVAAIGFAAVSFGRRESAAPPASTPAPQAAVANIAPLELVSLRHAQQAQSLTVTGLVQNPRTGAPLSRVVATAFVFGKDGTFLASSRAPLDFTTLAPGDESPFVVTVPVTGEVSRYRIGFRAEDGRVIAHVDKRVPDALAGLR